MDILQEYDTAFEVEFGPATLNEMVGYLTELGDPNDPSNKHYKYSDRFKFGITLRHVVSRIATGHPMRHKLENTRHALMRTLSGADRDDVSFLRRDLRVGVATLTKASERHPDQEERTEIKKHLAWLNGEYRDALTKRVEQLKAKD